MKYSFKVVKRLETPKLNGRYIFFCQVEELLKIKSTSNVLYFKIIKGDRNLRF